MKLSELDVSKLSKEQLYDLVLKGITSNVLDMPKDGKKTAIVVLGAKATAIKRRMIKAAELYKGGYGDTLILSGGLGWKGKANIGEDIKKVRESIPGMDEYSDETIFQMTEAEFMDKIAEFMDIPQENIIYEYYSENTLENAEYSVISSKVDKFERYIIVSDLQHMRRAELTFKKVQDSECEIICCSASGGLVEKSREQILREDMSKLECEAKKLVEYSKEGDILDVDVEQYINQSRNTQSQSVEEVGEGI